MTASLPCMQWFDEPMPRRPPVSPLDRDLCHPRLPRHPLARLGEELPGDLRRHVGRHRDGDEGILRRDPNAPAGLLFLPAALEVMRPGGHLADPVVGLRVPEHAERGRIDVGGIDARLADQGVRAHAQPIHDVVLQEPMRNDHVRTQQLLASRDLLVHRDPVVDDELQVQIRDLDAGIALARGRLADVATTPAEAEVAALDRVEQHRPVDGLSIHRGECGVTLELGQAEVGPQRGHDRADQVRQDVLRVIQLDIGQIAGVAGNVGDEEACGLRSRRHCCRS